jgi:hypothetical protein
VLRSAMYFGAGPCCCHPSPRHSDTVTQRHNGTARGVRPSQVSRRLDKRQPVAPGKLVQRKCKDSYRPVARRAWFQRQVAVRGQSPQYVDERHRRGDGMSTLFRTVGCCTPVYIQPRRPLSGSAGDADRAVGRVSEPSDRLEVRWCAAVGAVHPRGFLISRFARARRRRRCSTTRRGGAWLCGCACDGAARLCTHSQPAMHNAAAAAAAAGRQLQGGPQPRPPMQSFPRRRRSIEPRTFGPACRNPPSSCSLAVIGEPNIIRTSGMCLSVATDRKQRLLQNLSDRLPCAEQGPPSHLHSPVADGNLRLRPGTGHQPTSHRRSPQVTAGTSVCDTNYN